MIAAPSGAGKSSLVSAFLARHPDWTLSISTTTRPPRPGEQHGREYFFTSSEAFIRQRNAGEFLEWAEVHGNFYGTSREWIQSQRAARRSVILEIDWQGARQIRETFSDPGRVPRSVFILPPSLSELEARLRARGQDTEEVIQRRLAAAAEEMSHAEEFDYVIINQDFSVALRDLEAFVSRSWPAGASD
ncbi:MAG: guanylate kinase [Burkholderiaceae bacterium]|jgi:guanylate kinase|nr:guanylate kinase [Burkholderiaceae bacterium]